MTDSQPTRWERTWVIYRSVAPGIGATDYVGGEPTKGRVEVVPLSEAEAKVERLEEARHAYEKERDWLEGKLNECESERDEARAKADDRWRDGAIDALVAAQDDLEGELRKVQAERDEADAGWRGTLARAHEAEARIEQLEGALERIVRLDSAPTFNAALNAAHIAHEALNPSTPQPSGEARAEPTQVPRGRLDDLAAEVARRTAAIFRRCEWAWRDVGIPDEAQIAASVRHGIANLEDVRGGSSASGRFTVSRDEEDGYECWSVSLEVGHITHDLRPAPTQPSEGEEG